MLLSVVKHYRPCISGAVIEISEAADGRAEGQFKFLKHSIKYVKDTEKLGLLLIDRN
jgi:hypothetical protein